VLVLWVVILVPLILLTGFAVGTGYMTLTKTRLQNAADAGALAAVDRIAQGDFTTSDVKNIAKTIGTKNMPKADHGVVIKNIRVRLGTWDRETNTFAETNDNPDAVKVTAHRTAENSNALDFSFIPMMEHTANLQAVAIAAIVPARTGNGDDGQNENSGGQAVFRFLLDEEMFDSDEPAIEQLAAGMGVASEWPIMDNDGDGYLDIPAGTTLTLPSGQVGDEGLFDVLSWNQFPFQPTSEYSQLDFLAEGTALQDSHQTKILQDVEWSGSNAPHPELTGKKLLDPVRSIDPMDSHSELLNLPDPDIVYVSPVFKSDVSMAETDPSKYGSPAANLQGERRGLVAYRIIDATANSNGGSYLPDLTIEVLSPVDITTMESPDASSPQQMEILLVSE
jgi:Flp pilus assembly protein TadG